MLKAHCLLNRCTYLLIQLRSMLLFFVASDRARRQKLLEMTLLILLLPFAVNASEETIVVIDEAEYVLSNQELPPALYPEQKSLPDIWRLDNRFETSPTAWYRFTLPRDIPDSSWSVLLPKFTQNVDIFFNGIYIGTSDPTATMPINWNRPFVFELPQRHWNSESNQLEVRLTTMPNWGVLAPIAVGPNDAVWARYDTALFFQISTNQIASWLCLVLSLIAFLYWHADRKNSTYGWFGLAVFCWAILATNYYLTRFPISVSFWSAIFHSANEWFAVSMALFTHRYLNLKRPKVEFLLYGVALFATVAYLASYLVFAQRGPGVFHIISLLIGFYNAITTVTSITKQFDYRKLSYAIVTVSILVLFCHDSLFAQAAVGIQSPVPFYLAQLGVPLLLGFMLMVLTRDFVNVLLEARRTNDTLEERVSEISAELEQSYLDRQVLEREQATLKERDRIYHDIHDDLGAKLLSIVYQSDDDQTQELARSAIDDVRSIVSSSGSKVETFSLSTKWFEEVNNRCEQAGINLHWQCPQELALNDDQAYQMTRIIRELVTNALKHSQCDELRINIELDSKNIIVEVSDDGIGLINSVEGNGSNSIRHRAKTLGGEVSWENNEPPLKGSLVNLVIPH